MSVQAWQVSPWLPCGRSGNWTVRRCADMPDATQLVQVVDGADVLWMDDRPSEWAAHEAIRAAARGRLLLMGLGLGMLPAWLAQQESVESITIVENSPDVMRLVEPHLMAHSGSAKGIRVIHDDANCWAPANGEQYDVAWIDVTACDPILSGDIRTAWTSRLASFCGDVLFWEAL